MDFKFMVVFIVECHFAKLRLNRSKHETINPNIYALSI